jgi:hypothetical protein
MAQLSEERRRVGARIVLGASPAIVIGLFALAALDQPLDELYLPGSAPSRIVRGALLVLGFVLLVAGYRASRLLGRHGRTEVSVTLPPPETSPPLGSYPSLATLRDTRARLAGRYPTAIIEQFGRWAVSPADRLRLEETFTIELDKARIQSKAEFALDGLARAELDAAPGTTPVAVVPLLWLRKRTLLDDLVVTDAQDLRLVALSRPETATMVGWAVVPLLSLITTGATDTALDDQGWDLVDRIRQVLVYPEPVEPRRMWFRVLALLRAAGHPAEELRARSPEAFARFRELCQWLAEHYVLAVEAPLPAGNYLAIRYTHSVTVPSVGPETTAERVAQGIGLEPRRYLIPIRAAVWFASYHAEIDGRVRHQYVRRQHIVATDGPTPQPVDESMFASDTAHAPEQRPRMTLRNDSGYIYPHFHVTNLGAVSHRRSLGWLVEFEEIPPGGMAPVTALAASVALIAGVLSVAAARITELDLNAPALALAVPLFVITVFGFSVGGMLRSSLTVAFGFLGASLLAIGTVLSLLTLRRVTDSTDQFSVFDRPTLLGQHFHMLLGICSVAGMLLTLHLAGVLGVRLHRYRVHQQSVHGGS